MMRTTSMLLLLIAAGCAGDDAPIDTDADAATSEADAGPPDAETGCNGVDNNAAMIDEMRVDSTMPTPAGGTFPDGEYRLTARMIYTGPGGATGATGVHLTQTSVMVDGLAETITEQVIDGVPANVVTVAETYTLAANGTALTLTRACPTTQATSFDAFTEMSSGLIIFDTQNQSANFYARVP